MHKNSFILFCSQFNMLQIKDFLTLLTLVSQPLNVPYIFQIQTINYLWKILQWNKKNQ